MAPLRIRCVVSFSSQDAKYPVDNLLLEESIQPWLCCPWDRSRQLKVELQLEQASCIGYIDVGNCGSAFLQIEVGRSSWPPEQNYLPLLPTTALMVPADAKLGRNRSGVRMFKEGELLASAIGERWDRIRLTCSQPFNKHAQFGLSFLRIRTPRDMEGSQGNPAAASCQASPGARANSGLSSAAFCSTFSPGLQSSIPEEDMVLKSQLQRLDPAANHKGLNPAFMSRPARLVLKAAASACKRAGLLPAAPPPPSAGSKDGDQAQETLECSAAPGSNWEQTVRASLVKLKQRRGSCSHVRREGRDLKRKGRLQAKKGRNQEEERKPKERDAPLGTCPICAGCFPVSLLPFHASSCGEGGGARASSSSVLWEEPAESWVGCPICQFRFPTTEVESHASSCGE